MYPRPSYVSIGSADPSIELEKSIHVHNRVSMQISPITLANANLRHNISGKRMSDDRRSFQQDSSDTFRSS
jgi:hypothetical protein